MKILAAKNVYSFGLFTLLVSCQGSVMGPKQKKEKDRPVVVSSPPSSSSSSSSPSSESQRGSQSSPRATESRQKNPKESVFDPKNSTWIKDQNKRNQDSSSVVCSENSGLRFEWIVPTQASEWMNYFFSDLPPSIRSQITKLRPSVRLQVRSVGVDDQAQENYIIGLLSFSADSSFVRDFESVDRAVIYNLRSSDKFSMTLKDSVTYKKTLVLKLERRHVSRFDQNKSEKVKQSPWDGVLYSAYQGKLSPVARVSGFLELLSMEQVESLMSR